MIQDRVKARLARARANGKKLGRPKVSTNVERAIRQERKKGVGMIAIGKKLVWARASSNGL